jgi:catechol 2,3-dioxygenase-like lactoylglutathione lyase family enzyme
MARVSHVTDGAVQLGAPITGLSHVQLRVSDLRASTDWYSAVLGLELQAKDVDAGYVALRHRRARLVIVLTAAPDRSTEPVADAEGESRGPSQWGSLDHLAFAVPDGGALRAWGDHLAGMGVRHQGVVLENGNPSLQLRDPDGNAIELVAPARP